MSYDLYFWPAGATDRPARLAKRLAGEKATSLAPDQRVLAFRDEVLRRWPELADRIAPWHHDLGGRRPWGRTDLADRYVVLTLSFAWPATAALPALAAAHDLECYDPQAGAMLRPGDAATRGFRGGPIGEVRGWVDEANVVRLLAQVSRWIGYPYDDLDEVALTGALDDTDDESAAAWFEYPLAGSPALTVRLARSPGSAVAAVRVAGDLDVVLAARVETLVELL